MNLDKQLIWNIQMPELLRLRASGGKVLALTESSSGFDLGPAIRLDLQNKYSNIYWTMNISNSQWTSSAEQEPIQSKCGWLKAKNEIPNLWFGGFDGSSFVVSGSGCFAECPRKYKWNIICLIGLNPFYTLHWSAVQMQWRITTGSVKI